MKPRKKPNFFRIHSPRLNKLFWWLFSITTIIDVVFLLSLLTNFIFGCVWGKEHDLYALYGDGYERFMDIMMMALILSLMAFAIVVLFNYMTNYDQHFESKATAEANSPITDTAKPYEPQIIDLLTSIARPSSGKQYLNRAPTAQFLRALTELGYMDANVSGPNLKTWVENVTGYNDKDKDSGHFYSAYNTTTKEDSKVRKYMDQIKQIVNP